MHVVIDGVEYVPATSIANVEKLLRVLALQYHTPDTLAEYGTEGLRIVVSEDDDEGETFEEFAARLTTTD